LILAEILDLKLWEFPPGISDEVAEDILLVVTDEHDFFDVFDFRDGLQAMPDDGVTSDVEQRLLVVSLSTR
jgi:hypothetical protein